MCQSSTLFYIWRGAQSPCIKWNWILLHPFNMGAHRRSIKRRAINHARKVLHIVNNQVHVEAMTATQRASLAVVLARLQGNNNEEEDNA